MAVDEDVLEQLTSDTYFALVDGLIEIEDAHENSQFFAEACFADSDDRGFRVKVTFGDADQGVSSQRYCEFTFFDDGDDEESVRRTLELQLGRVLDRLSDEAHCEW